MLINKLKRNVIYYIYGFKRSEKIEENDFRFNLISSWTFPSLTLLRHFFMGNSTVVPFIQEIAIFLFLLYEP